MTSVPHRPYPLATQAIRSGDLVELQRIFDAYPEIKNLDVPGFATWLHYACSYGNVDIVQYIVSLGYDINASGRDNQTPIVDAAYRGKFEIAEYLLDHGAIMDVRTSLRNPLFGAIVGRSPQVASLLIDRGIDISATYNTQTMKNMDAIAFAMMQGTRDIARMIAEKKYGDDEEAIEAALEEGLRIAYENTEPVPPGEHVRPS